MSEIVGIDTEELGKVARETYYRFNLESNDPWAWVGLAVAKRALEMDRNNTVRYSLASLGIDAESGEDNAEMGDSE